MSIDVRVAHINVHQPATDAVRKYNIQGVIEHIKDGGVGTLNEIGKTADHNYLASLKPFGIGSYVYGELGVVWDAKRFETVWTGKYRIMVGGHVGADGTPAGPDNRRVGPSRWVLIVVLKDRATGIVFQADTTHLVARAFTVNKWRQGIFKASTAVAGLRINNLNSKYPNGFLNGDMNFIGPKLDFPHLSETQLPPLRTLGNQRYDRAFVWGNVKVVEGPSTFKRKSDHLGFTYVVRIGDGPSPGVPPVSHTGGGSVNPGPRVKPQPRPVPRPWRRRTRRWKRRHPRLWKRIIAWRKKHPLKKKR